LKKYYTPDILEEGYTFSESGIYYAPNYNTLQEYRDFIDNFPPNASPEVFGLHENATLSFQVSQSKSMLETILDIQPRISSGGGGKSSDDIVADTIAELQENQPALLDITECAKNLFKPNSQGILSCFATVLLQEIERFNKLLSYIDKSLTMLNSAIQGLEIMSNELDQMYNALMKNQVPSNWEEIAYPSLKPLSSWIIDLIERVEFMRIWLTEGHPN
jgi:dynein heavy chain